MSSRTRKIAIFIDGPNLHAKTESLGFDVDYKLLLRAFESRGVLTGTLYYTALVEDQEFSTLSPLVDWLDYNGHTVVTKPAKEFVDAFGRRKVKANMDVELAVAAMGLAEFSGDGDFRSLVEAVQRCAVRVTVVSSIACQPAMIADELRRQADAFVDLRDLEPRIGRKTAGARVSTLPRQ